MTINSFESFLQHLDMPKACELNKPVFKKLFLDASDGKRPVLDTTDKKCLADDVNKVRWLYTLKPSTINIAPYRDQAREYPEVAVLQVALSSANRVGRVARIANFINRSIPYPLVLIFTVDAEAKTSVAISLADKRINQADKEKWVLEDSIHTGWIELSDSNLGDQESSQAEFLASLKISELPFKDFWAFYQALMARVIAINCAVHSGTFLLESEQKETDNNRLDKLHELEKLDIQRSKIANKLKQEKQMGKQVELNTKVKKINDRIAEIKASL